QCRLNLVRLIDLSLTQPLSQILRGNVEIHDLIGLSDDPIRNGLTNGDTELALEYVVERFKVLHVDRGDDVDPLVEEEHHVLPPFAVSRAGDIRMRELVDD